MAGSADRWIGQFAEAAGAAPPDAAQTEKLLKLAAVAAHSSERIAAPLACWIAGGAGLGLDDAIALAEGIEPGAGRDAGP